MRNHEKLTNFLKDKVFDTARFVALNKYSVKVVYFKEGNIYHTFINTRVYPVRTIKTFAEVDQVIDLVCISDFGDGLSINLVNSDGEDIAEIIFDRPEYEDIISIK